MSKSSILWTALAVTAFSLAGCELAGAPDTRMAPGATPPGSAPAPGGARGRGAAVPAGLGQAMQEMGRMLTAIKADSADVTKNEQTLRNIATLARDVAIAKLGTPPDVNRMANADEKAKALASFRSGMNNLTRTLLDLEDAVIAKKPDDIKKAIAKLEEFEKAGHAEFHVGG